MVAVVLRDHDIGWLTPSPTWGDFGALGAASEREAFLRPAILRFAHDAFMEELHAALAYVPEKLGEWRAIPETWEKPMPAPPSATAPAQREPVSLLSVRLSRQAAQRTALTTGAPAPRGALQPSTGEAAAPLKLYQPVQQRHYLVAASLVCRTPGLPDRRIDAGKQERGAYVLRRIVPPAGENAPSAEVETWDEYAFVAGADGGTWQRVKSAADGSARTLVPGEERLPLFPIGFDELSGRKRRLLAGLIPVGRREAYVNADVQAAQDSAATTSGASEAPADPRLLLFQMRVTAPWSELVEQSLDEAGRVEASGTPASDALQRLARAREQAQTVSWYVLLDFERFLHDHLPSVWDVLAGNRSRSLLKDEEETLLHWLERVVLHVSLRSSLSLDNLLAVLQHLARDPSIGEGLEQVDIPYDQGSPSAGWPEFRFPLADAGANGPFPFSVDGTALSGHTGSREDVLAKTDDALAELVNHVDAALPPGEGARLPEIKVPSNPNVDTRAAWFAIRCVYERPNCGPFDPPVLSEPTEPFQMASFFDPDAPARAVRIPMPLDVSPAGLRKFSKSATLQISDMLCGQLKRIRKMTLGDLVLSVLPWPFHKDLPDPSGAQPCKKGGNPLGMFCSLSIPIVTLCALVLMIIIVSLFDVFFRWLPYLFMCLPIPGLKGKRP